jgi:phage terminase small subunit
MLHPRKKKFVEVYIRTLNAAEAYRQAGYSAPDNHTAAAGGHRMLTRVDIQEELQRRQKVLAEREEVTTNKVLDEFARCGFSNMEDYLEFDDAGVRLKASTELGTKKMAAISEVGEVTTEHGKTIKFKLHDKIRALENLGEHLGLFPKKLDLTTGGKPIATTVVVPAFDGVVAVPADGEKRKNGDTVHTSGE